MTLLRLTGFVLTERARLLAAAKASEGQRQTFEADQCKRKRVVQSLQGGVLCAHLAILICPSTDRIQEGQIETGEG